MGKESDEAIAVIYEETKYWIVCEPNLGGLVVSESGVPSSCTSNFFIFYENTHQALFPSGIHVLLFYVYCRRSKMIHKTENGGKISISEKLARNHWGGRVTR